jgi:hypothetical protein
MHSNIHSENNTLMNSNENTSTYEYSEKEGEHSSTLFNRAMGYIKATTNITSLLRISGAITVLVSMSLFLLQGWSQQNDTERFFMMLAQTTLLSLAGFAMVKILKETKGARLFFGLSLTSVTANFATLGALIYSVFSIDKLTGDYANFALWEAHSAGIVLASIAIALLILLPVVWLTFSVLIKSMAKPLTLSYVGINLLLLVPVRDIAIIMPITIGVLLWLFSHQLFGKHKNSLTKAASAITKEGWFARLTLLFPLVVMALRSGIHYPIDSLGTFIICVSLYLLSTFSISKVNQSYSSILTSCALVMAVICAAILAFELFTIGLPLFAIIITAACTDLYYRNYSNNIRLWLLSFACIFVNASFFIEHWIHPSFASITYALASGTMMIAIGLHIKARLLLWSGAILLIAIPLSYLQDITTVLVNSGWLGLAITGTVIIVLASVIERYGAIIRLKLSKSEKS